MRAVFFYTLRAPQLCSMSFHGYPNNDGGRNMPGQNRFYWLPKENITAIPASTNNIISSDITATSDWYEGYISWQSDDFEYKSERSSHGTQYQVNFKGKVPKFSPQMESLFHSKANREFVLIIVDNNGYGRVCGNKTKGLKFTFETLKDGYNFNYTGTFSTPQPYYGGLISVDDVVTGLSLGSVNTYVRAARIHYGAGVPSNAFGNDFDSYIDTLTRNLYYKTNGVWTFQLQIANQTLTRQAFLLTSLRLTGNF